MGSTTFGSYSGKKNYSGPGLETINTIPAGDYIISVFIRAQVLRH